eukprot:9477020-Pyramimonas_sp.AAC.1
MAKTAGQLITHPFRGGEDDNLGAWGERPQNLSQSALLVHWIDHLDVLRNGLVRYQIVGVTDEHANG